MNREPDDSEEARTQRAARLHAQIEQLAKGGPVNQRPAVTGPSQPKSPREFIHERMAELAKGRKRRSKVS